MATLSGLLSVFGSSLSKTAPPKPSNSGLWKEAESVSFSPPVTLPDGTSVVYELSLRYSARFEIQRLPSVLTLEVAKSRLHGKLLPVAFLCRSSWILFDILIRVVPRDLDSVRTPPSDRSLFKRMSWNTPKFSVRIELKISSSSSGMKLNVWKGSPFKKIEYAGEAIPKYKKSKYLIKVFPS